MNHRPDALLVRGLEPPPRPVVRLRAARVAAAAMFDDPLMRALLPSPAVRRRVLPALFALIVERAARTGMLCLSSTRVEALAAWEVPGRVGWGGALLLLPRALEVATRNGPAAVMRMIRYFRYASALHGRHAGSKAWYLALVAVAPSLQGRSYATRLLRPVLDRLDREGRSCYLETQNPANVPLYEHFGFRVVERGVVPGLALQHWCMLRRPP